VSNYVGKDVIVGLALLGILLAGAVYGVGYQSARGLQLEIVSIDRSYNTSWLLGYAEFIVQVRLWSAGSLDVTLGQIGFQLSVDLITFPVIQVRDTMLPNGEYFEYILTFETYSAPAIQYISQHNSYEISVSMAAWASSGIYSGWSSASYSRAYSWS
jgi:hypothetical protein